MICCCTMQRRAHGGPGSNHEAPKIDRRGDHVCKADVGGYSHGAGGAPQASYAGGTDCGAFGQKWGVEMTATALSKYLWIMPPPVDETVRSGSRDWTVTT